MIGSLNQETTALFVVDIQTSFLKSVVQIDEIIINNKCLIESFFELKIPILMSQHNKKKFGEIVEPLRYCERLSSSPLSIIKVFDKTTYSMYTEELGQYIQENLPYLKSIILTGLESHVCVLQTALNLLEKGYEVHVLNDAVASVNSKELKSSLKRMKQSGVFLTSTESIIYQILLNDNHPNFKKIEEFNAQRLFQLNNITFFLPYLSSSGNPPEKSIPVCISQLPRPSEMVGYTF
ncbi:hypothetical protein RB653_001653 [Dictyostelium firmibasis]|uniref:Isochorismatase-like domain-containing protein n=1 Tax=Dictyostelium firmibasis TaxID=79012 RepID=A0AAN7YWT6_9MYCE